MAATSKAAEHWRRSWRERQYAEAGPAQDVSKGHASVPSPLMTMQQSFARMRAIINVNKQQESRSSSFGFWGTLFLMLCLIGGLSAYIISTYLPNAPFGAAHVAQPGSAQEPFLVIQGTSALAVGKVVHLHGERFGAHDSISFLLDTTIPILDTNGNKITVQADDQGAFDATISISSDWPLGAHIIEAFDNQTNQAAYLSIQVNPAGSPVTSSPDLNLSVDGKPVQQLSFTSVLGHGNPDSQRLTFTNTSGAPLKWSATAIAANNLSWLYIVDNRTSGSLAISQPGSIDIGVNVTGLKSTAHTKPYTGQILFTINDREQLTLPVQLQIADAAAEMISSPDPIIAVANADGTCEAGAALTLINIGSIVITWNVTPDQNIQSNIQFTINGRPTEQGNLQPSGQPGDTQVLALRCHGVQVGRQYHVTIGANGMQWSEFIIIQQQ